MRVREFFDKSIVTFSLFVRSALSMNITKPNNQTLKDVSLRRTVLYKQRLDLAQKLCKKHNLFKKSNKIMTDNLLWNIPHQVSLYIIIFIQFLCYFSYFYNFSLFIVLIWKLVYQPGLTFFKYIKWDVRNTTKLLSAEVKNSQVILLPIPS